MTDLGSVGPSRVTRPFKGFFRALKHLRSNRPAILHFHDPELIPLGMAAKVMGIRVIYDVHEDVPRQLKARDSHGMLLRNALAICAGVTEWIAARVLDAMVCATPTIAARFPERKTTVVQNFPIVGELALEERGAYADRPRRFVYIGGITEKRGVREMMQAAGEFGRDSGVELNLAGTCFPENLRQELEQPPGAANTRFLGVLDRRQVAELLASARAGLVVLHDTPNYVNSQPIKLYEYMSAGLPVIASDFPLWRELIDGIGNGLLVDPKDPQAIREAMQWILEHPDEAEAMGRRGQQAVESGLNWEHEASKLVALYERIAPAAAQISVR